MASKLSLIPAGLDMPSRSLRQRASYAGAKMQSSSFAWSFGKTKYPAIQWEKFERGERRGHEKGPSTAYWPCKSTTRYSSEFATPGDDRSLIGLLSSIYKFSRPHTMLGTLVSVISISLLGCNTGVPLFDAVKHVAKALVPALLMNICIVGLNQIYDIEIDKINKPYLPLASGELRVDTAWWIVGSSGFVSLALGALAQSQPLILTLSGSLLLGILYSMDLPLMRWKKYPAVAAACILSVRAVLVQFGFFFHMKLCQSTGIIQNKIGLHDILAERSLLFATMFMFVFSIVIAMFKDIPDMDGDGQAGVKTFTVRLGPKRVFWTCITLLELAYMSSIGYSIAYMEGATKLVSIALHGLMSLFLWSRAHQTDLRDPKSIYNCYMDVWKAFYAEYLFVPLFR
ncbi:hypothetical protein M9434_002985 [Picochlorum sp. BPE23]|nr:hypothetical protein M9434_002985 [Picochlorum sp. BPE23]